ncbi:MAG TPA: hypothetical protein VGF07_03200 [Stellaceae bacterium]|jgi:hypothetical protein
MKEARSPSAAYYRQVAAEILGLARKTRLPELRAELIELAERFRRMAAYANRRPGGRDEGAAALRDDTERPAGPETHPDGPDEK